MLLFEMFEQQESPKHAAFCFGRMNPPTVGHGQLINTVAKASQGGDYFIFVSQTQDSKKNPLDYATKVKFIKALFPQQAGHVVYNPELKTIMQVAEWLYNAGYRSVTFAAGSDRLDSFKKLLTDYNGKEGGNVYYKFDSINFVSSGDRDPDADGIAGVSASSAREAASQGNLEAFAQATGAGKLAKPLYDAVRKGMLLEGWKGALAGAALIGGIGASVALSNPITIGDVTYLSNWAGPDSPAEMQSSQVITHNGKKYLVWKGQGSRPRNRAMFYKEIKPEQDAKSNNLGFDKEKWKKPTEIEPTDMWVNETASGYIPKNKREAKDPRWSNALTVDVHPDTPNKNMKALGLI
jgi:hypothetical protein